MGENGKLTQPLCPQAPACDVDEVAALLARTPSVLQTLLRNGPGASVAACGDEEATWTPFQVIDHLLHGEREDWIPRMRVLLGRRPAPRGPARLLEQLGASRRAHDLPELLAEFSRARAQSVERLRALELSPADLDRPCHDEDFGPVTPRELLMAWLVHDVGHVEQIVDAMGRRSAD